MSTIDLDAIIETEYGNIDIEGHLEAMEAVRHVGLYGYAEEIRDVLEDRLRQATDLVREAAIESGYHVDEGALEQVLMANSLSDIHDAWEAAAEPAGFDLAMAA